MAVLNFDARQVAPATGTEPVPAGWYKVVIDESEMKPTKAGDGYYLKLRYNIMDGQFANRKIFGNINLQNPNQQATEIGLKQLSAVAHAVQVLLVQDSQQLHNIPLKIKVKVRTDKTGEYDPNNEITRWANINEQTDDTAAPAAGAPAFAPAAGAAPGFPGGASAPVMQPWAQPGAAAPAAAQQPPPNGMPAWAAAPAASAAPPAATPQWAPPGGAPAGVAPAGAPGGFSGQTAVPPWAKQ